MENANNPQTERKRPALLFAQAFAILLNYIQLLLMGLGRVELPTSRLSGAAGENWLTRFRAFIGVRSGRLLLYRKEPPAERSQFRKQNANTKAGRGIGSPAFWVLIGSRNWESNPASRPTHVRPRGVPETRQLNRRELLAIAALQMRMEAGV